MAGTGQEGKHMTCESRGHNGTLTAYLEKESCYFIKPRCPLSLCEEKYLHQDLHKEVLVEPF